MREKDIKLIITFVVFILFSAVMDYRITKLEEQLLETVRIQNNLLKQWRQNLEEKQKTVNLYMGI